MEQPKEDSNYKLLGLITIKFSTEPLWYRLTVIFGSMAAMILIVWILKEWILPASLMKKVSEIKFTDFQIFGKGKSP